jgi:hypothetical protein
MPIRSIGQLIHIEALKFVNEAFGCQRGGHFTERLAVYLGIFRSENHGRRGLNASAEV